MSSSEYRIVMPSTSAGVFSGGAGASGSRTCSQAPAASRSDLPARAPSSSTSPFSASVAATVRDSPSRRASPASTRMPARPSGTGMDRSVTTASGLVAGAAAADRGGVGAEHRTPEQHYRPAHDRRHGNGEHEP